MRGPYPYDHDIFEIVCWDEETKQYGFDRYDDCEMSYKRYQQKAKLPASLDGSYREWQEVDSLYFLFSRLEKCGYDKRPAKVNKGGVQKAKPKVDVGNILLKALGN